jgi:hypothetical protein
MAGQTNKGKTCRGLSTFATCELMRDFLVSFGWVNTGYQENWNLYNTLKT